MSLAGEEEKKDEESDEVDLSNLLYDFGSNFRDSTMMGGRLTSMNPLNKNKANDRVNK